MARVSTYLNFSNQTEEAFNFYKSVFGTDFVGDIARMGDAPPQPGQPELSEDDQKLVMHIQLPIVGDHMLHGTDAPESMGFTVDQGNNIYIMLELDRREDADRYFSALSQGGAIEMPLSVQFWGDYFGSLIDKYGVRWMFNVAGEQANR
ncbi:MAG TPA: VOC family protein [Acidimicrobiia bacterium]|nr:VOC family protein [Acidimicrobiia bacterium]